MGFHVSVDCGASVAYAESWNAQEASTQLSALVESLCGGDEVIDRRALCVSPGNFVWEVQVEVLVLTCGSNLLDSATLALCAALTETTLPKVSVIEAMEEGEVIQLKVDDRPEMGS